MFGFKLPRYSKLLKKSNSDNEDKGKKALFWIIAKNKELYAKVNYLYDFDKDSIRPEILEEETINLSENSKALLKLGFNLFSGYIYDNTDVLSIFNRLDNSSFRIGIGAILLRYGRERSRF